MILIHLLYSKRSLLYSILLTLLERCGEGYIFTRVIQIIYLHLNYRHLTTCAINYEYCEFFIARYIQFIFRTRNDIIDLNISFNSYPEIQKSIGEIIDFYSVFEHIIIDLNDFLRVFISIYFVLYIKSYIYKISLYLLNMTFFYYCK